jgi:hypothetical protein
MSIELCTDPKTDADSQNVIDNVCVLCQSSVVVAIALSQKVACPGIPFAMNAIGDPAGGIYTWKVEGGAARLIDGAGASTFSGDKVFLQSFQTNNLKGSIPPVKVSVSVTYTHSTGQASATEVVSVHEVNFSVTGAKCVFGSPTTKEVSAGVYVGHPRMISNGIADKDTLGVEIHACVEILVGDSCLNKEKCIANYRIGWLQNQLGSESRAVYEDKGKNRNEYKYLLKKGNKFPLLDCSHGADIRKPFYLPPDRFSVKKTKICIDLQDTPVDTWEWYDSDSLKTLREAYMTNRFNLWIAVDNVQCLVIDKKRTFVFLNHLSFVIDLAADIAVDKPLLGRSKMRYVKSKLIQNFTLGKGSNDPVTDGTLANDALDLNPKLTIKK